MNSILREICLLLVLVIPCLVLSNRMRFGSILGLLAGGVLIGPSGFDLIQTSGAIDNVAELAVVLFLFVVGIELNATQFGKSWKRLLSFGLLQVVLTGIVLSVFLIPYSNYWYGAALAGFTLAMSSTALVMQTLRERGELKTKMGSTAVGILIVQDLAVVPLLAIIPILNARRTATESISPTLESILLPLGAITLLVVANRFIFPKCIEHFERRNDSNSLTAMIAFAVLGSAYLADSAGLSMPLGAFIAGISLSTSSSAERVRRIVVPHQSLLMALFFVSVGLSINRHDLAGQFWTIAIAVPSVVALKILCLYGLARFMGTTNRASWRLALILAQAGEFGFIVVAVLSEIGWTSPTQAASSIAIIALTMLITPIIQRFITPLTDDIERA